MHLVRATVAAPSAVAAATVLPNRERHTAVGSKYATSSHYNKYILLSSNGNLIIVHRSHTLRPLFHSTRVQHIGYW